MILHQGTTINSGHYIAATKNECKWVIHDDDELPEVYENPDQFYDDINEHKDKFTPCINSLNHEYCFDDRVMTMMLLCIKK